MVASSPLKVPGSSPGQQRCGLPGSVTTTQPCCLSTKSTWAESVSANPGSGWPADQVDHEEPLSVVALIASWAWLLAEEDTTHPLVVFWKYTPMIAPAGTPGGVTAVQVCPPFEVMERAPVVRTQPVFPRTSCAARIGNEAAGCGLTRADVVTWPGGRRNPPAASDGAGTAVPGSCLVRARQALGSGHEPGSSGRQNRGTCMRAGPTPRSPPPAGQLADRQCRRALGPAELAR